MVKKKKKELRMVWHHFEWIASKPLIQLTVHDPWCRFTSTLSVQAFNNPIFLFFVFSCSFLFFRFSLFVFSFVSFLSRVYLSLLFISLLTLHLFSRFLLFLFLCPFMSLPYLFFRHLSFGLLHFNSSNLLNCPDKVLL